MDGRKEGRERERGGREGRERGKANQCLNWLARGRERKAQGCHEVICYNFLLKVTEGKRREEEKGREEERDKSTL